MATDAVHDAGAADTDQPDPVAQAFRARYQLLEKTIPRLFRDDHPCCAASELDLSALEPEDVEMLDVGGDAPPPAKPPPRIRVEEDYDFDEDDDEPDEPAKPAAAPPPPPPQLKSSLSGSSAISANSQSGAGAAGGCEVKVTREKLEADRKAAEDSARRAFETLFFTLENDRDAMLEQKQLEESDRQVNAEANAATEAQQPGKLASANLGASNLTLKHLIARIDAKRERVKVSDMELRNLMSEVRKNRSKWASEDKIGQEELYEAAEKVVLELRANTEHSTAFLNRVNKREAPDYYQIIKQPMDLGTVMKKLKQHQYKSKKEFVEDLNRIWENCLTYNADPSHFLRKHAKAMKKMTASLEPLIPDIVIRDRAEVEAEEAGQVDAEGESDDEPIMSSRGRKAPGSKKSRKGASSAPREGTPDVKPPVVHLVRADSNPPGNDCHSQTLSVNGFPTPTSGTPAPNGVTSSMIHMDFEQDDDTGDAEYQAWKKITKKGRAKVASQRHKLIRGTRLNPEEPALIRSRVGMARNIRASLKHLKGIEEDTDEPMETVHEEAEEEDEQSLLPDYYDPLSCVPELPWRTVWAADEGEVEMPDTDENALRLAPRGMFVAPKSQLSTAMDANLKKMQDTRKVCSKITVIKQMQVQTQIYANQFTKYDPKEFVEQDVDEFVISDDGPVMCGEVARAALQRSIGKVFYHAGFEEFQPSALEAATDIATDYFQKIGKTLMVYKEAPQHERQFTPEEILLHALYENGADVESLQSYVRDDIERLGTKLTTIHERMKSYLAELLRPALADTGGDDSKLFNDGSEQFVGGDFAEDIGDDFFGFKELGLDKEFGLASLSVPLHLLQGKMNNAYQPANAVNAAASGELHKPPPPFEPLTRSLLKSQIALVQPYFLAKFSTSATVPVSTSVSTIADPSDPNSSTSDPNSTNAASDSTEDALIEDEDLPVKQRPPKPRLPPTGKISMPRKRPLQSQGGGSKKKKKLNPNTSGNSSNQSPSKGGAGKSGGQDGTGGGGDNKENRKDSGAGMVRSFSKMSEDGGNGGMMSPESLVA